jgi:hypothetical protein
MTLLCLSLTAFSGEKDIIDPTIYDAFAGLTAKRTTDEGVRIIVHLADRNDINDRTVDSMARVAQSVLETQNQFLTALEAEGRIAQPGVVQKRNNAGFQPVLMLDYQYAIAGYIEDPSALDYLASLPEVTYLEYDKLNELYTVEGRQLTGSDTVASAGYAGQGIGVAVIDSNFDLLHSELGGSTSLPNGVVYGGYNYSSGNNQIHSQYFNDCYHGTGTASIVRRYAPSSHLYTLVVFPNAYDSTIANAINWCITNKNGVNGGNPIKVISMSLGGGQYSGTCNSGLMHTAAGNAVSNGLLVFAASGNDGWTSSMGSPACSSNVISIGSVWDENGAAYSPFGPAYCSDSNRQVDERACYSDTSSVLDLYAPSEEVICAQCGGGTWALGGTSSATPAAAGMTAQLLSYDGSYAGDKSGVVSLFQSTGASVIGDSGKKRIDLANAVGTGGGGTGGGSCSGDLYTGTLSSGGYAYEPNGNYYYQSGSATHAATLEGPSGTDFDLYLWKWNGSGWSTVASSTSASSSESISYNGSSGYYVWRVESYSGSGSYDLCVTSP